MLTRTDLSGSPDPGFAALNSREFDDSWLVRESDDVVTVWVGDCCRRCEPGYDVRFTGVRRVVFSDADEEINPPRFRLAADEEARTRGWDVPRGCGAYLIESADARESFVLIVASAVEISPGKTAGAQHTQT